MAKAFTQWTVLPHGPIEKLTENLWRVEGKMPDGRTQRQMLVVRRNDELVIYNAIALDDAEMRELEAFGKPAALIVPNGFHRQDALIYKQRYPSLKVYSPAAAIKRVCQVLPVDGDFDAFTGDDTVRLVHLEGLNKGEGVMQVASNDGATLVFNDALMNMARQKGVMGVVLSPTGRPSVPRLMRWMMVRDRRLLAQHLEKLASTPGLARVLVGHGAPILTRPGEALKLAARELVGRSEAPEAVLAH